MHEVNFEVFSYYQALCERLTFSQACAVLDTLDKYSFETVWDSLDGLWTPGLFRSLPIAETAKLGSLQFKIQFVGGPNNNKFWHGYVISFVLDRLLISCLKIGRAETYLRIDSIID